MRGAGPDSRWIPEGGGALKRRLSPATLALAGGLLALGVALNLPLFEAGESPYRGSIEGGYASMARFFSEHPNPWGWNPTQYGGMPAQFTYLPALPYLAAAVSRAAPNLGVDYAYRLVASALACLEPVTLFGFVLYFTGSRWWGASAGLAYTFFSPAYYAIHAIDMDRGAAYLPWRLQVLVKYGEGPHNAGLTLLPLAMVALWETATRPGFRRMLVAALLLAAVTLTNWVAALALAFCCLMLLASLAGSAAATGFRAGRVMAASALAYGLACFWLTPSFIRTIAFNWPADAFNYRLSLPQTLLLAGLPIALLASRVLLARLFAGQYYLWFVTLASLGFAWVVLWFYWGGLNTIPESRRYTLEFEMFLMLACFGWLRLALRASIEPLRYFAIYIVFAVFLSGWGQFRQYATQGFAARRPVPRESTIEYRLARELARLQPRGRVFASGGLRFRLNSWLDIPQVGGGFESGLTNRRPLDLAYRIRTGRDPVAALTALGAEYVVVNGPRSREYYRDFRNPRQFDGALEVAWRDEDDTIYRVPFTSLADGMAVSWRGASELWLEGAAASSVSVKINYDPGWRAEQDGRPIGLERDAAGFLVLHPHPGPRARIRLRYTGSSEQHWMAALSALVWAGALTALFTRRS